jgi:hypothetical protein
MSAPEVTAAQFFDEQIPRLIASASVAPKRSGDVVFEIVGAGGGRWRLHLAKRPRIDRVDPWARGDLLIRMDEASFPEFYSGTIDLAEQIERGAMMLAGDLSLLDELAAMWRAPMSMIALRAKDGSADP